MRRKHDARYAFKERKRLGSGTSARTRLTRVVPRGIVMVSGNDGP